MRINFHTTCIQPMYDWLLTSKKEGIRDEARLREILKLPDYQVEFARYGDKYLPVCNLTFEEVVDFFLNFDKKDFANQRLQYKKDFFLKFYNDLEEKIKVVNFFNSLNEEDIDLVKKLLVNGLPESLVKKDLEYDIILIISIGNSMGWPYEHYIDFDIANLDMFTDKSTFLHIIAHEIHHTMFGDLIDENITGSEAFVVNFAFEGLAVHFNNNAYTVNKASKYPGPMVGMVAEDWAFYEEQFDELFAKFRNDISKTSTMDMDQLQEYLGQEYEKFTFTNLKTGVTKNISQYPTYYLGCYFWGIIDLAFGKEVLFDTLKHPKKFVEVYNKAATKFGYKNYLL